MKQIYRKLAIMLVAATSMLVLSSCESTGSGYGSPRMTVHYGVGYGYGWGNSWHRPPHMRPPVHRPPSVRPPIHRPSGPSVQPIGPIRPRPTPRGR